MNESDFLATRFVLMLSRLISLNSTFICKEESSVFTSNMPRRRLKNRRAIQPSSGPPIGFSNCDITIPNRFHLYDIPLIPPQLLKPYTEPWPLDNFSRLKNRRALQHEEIFDRRRRHLQVDEETLMTLKYRARQCARVLKKLRNLLPPQPFVLQAKLRIGEALRRLTLDGILLQVFF